MDVGQVFLPLALTLASLSAVPPDLTLALLSAADLKAADSTAGWIQSRRSCKEEEGRAEQRNCEALGKNAGREES
jgi:hypothetical protein